MVSSFEHKFLHESKHLFKFIRCIQIKIIQWQATIHPVTQPIPNKSWEWLYDYKPPHQENIGEAKITKVLPWIIQAKTELEKTKNKILFQLKMKSFIQKRVNQKFCHQVQNISYFASCNTKTSINKVNLKRRKLFEQL